MQKLSGPVSTDSIGYQLSFCIIIGGDGCLTDYGGRAWRKKWLLDFEKKKR